MNSIGRTETEVLFITETELENAYSKTELAGIPVMDACICHLGLMLWS